MIWILVVQPVQIMMHFFEAFVPLHIDYETETSVVTVSPDILKSSVIDDDTARAIGEAVSESM